LADLIQRIGESQIQHGPYNDRIYALELASSDMPDVLDDLEGLARAKGYGKVVAKARESDFGAFMERGYRVEARIPEFFGIEESGLLVGKFFDPRRAREEHPDRVAEVLMTAQLERALTGFREEAEPIPLEAGSNLRYREALPEDAETVASCYEAVFESYPFPIHDPAHIKEAQEEGTRFFSVWKEDSLVAASAMEPGGAPGVVEMTDFATLPAYRGRGLATRLLGIMGRQAIESGVRLAYTIARAMSFGMNITFARQAYQYGGTLINNTQIAGSIESMNVWYRLLGPDAQMGAYEDGERPGLD
jgi:putative beta-lysine N-acetyltransferase